MANEVATCRVLRTPSIERKGVVISIEINRIGLKLGDRSSDVTTRADEHVSSG